MTGFCGYVIKQPARFNDADRARLDAPVPSLSRFPGDHIVVRRTPAALFAYYDYHDRDPRVEAQAGWAGVVCGDPVWVEDGETLDFESGRAKLLAALVEEDRCDFASAKGVFAAASVDLEAQQVRLLANKFGTRPIYYLDRDELFIFASSRRVMFAMAEGFTSVDPGALGQVALTRHIFGNATLAKEIRTLRGGEMLRFDGDSAAVRTYYSLADVPARPLSYEACLAELHARFMTAVERRVRALDNDAMLSGGLDSRAVVAALRALGCNVQTLTLAKAKSYDAVLGPRIAAKLGTRHRLVLHTLGERVRKTSFLGYVREYMPRRADRTPSAQSVWAGDGGSVVLGHTYLTEARVAMAEAGDAPALLRDFYPLLGDGKRVGILKTAEHDTLKAKAVEEISREVNALNRPDLKRKLFYFLVRGDQERHHYNFFENIDIWRVDPIQPFFDPDFVEFVFSTPIEHYLRHRIYNDFIGLFEGADKVPWQAYRGHIPGPLPLPAEASDQWSLSRNFEAEPVSYYLWCLDQLRAVRLPGLGDYLSGLYISFWKLRVRLRLAKGPRVVKLAARIVAFAGGGRLPESPGSYGNRATVVDTNG